VSGRPESATLERVFTPPEADPPEVSVIVLVTGQPEPLDALYLELLAALRVVSRDLEFIFVVDPGFVGLTASLGEASGRGDSVRVVRVGQPLGYTGLLRAGLPYCRGSIIVTVPARRRVETAAFAKLVQAVKSGADMAVASRGPQRASLLGAVRSRVFHALATRVVPTPMRMSDFTSGVRAVRREVLDTLPLYGDSATVLPLLALREGFSVVEVAAARHASDNAGVLHSPFTYLRSLFDLFSLFFLLRFTERPLRFFGLVGTAALLPGILITGVVGLQRLGGRPAADRPLLLLGVVFVVLGIQMIALGLIGEIIVHLHAAKRPSYRLRRSDEPGI
jgi:hypothetical protein